MRTWVLSRLAVHPVIIVVMALVAPLSIIWLFAAASRSTGTQLFVSSLVGFAFGLTVGTVIADAARCSFSWTLPGFRRDCILGFVACGLLGSGVVAAIMGAGGSGASAAASGAASFAGFTAGGAVALTPEGPLAVPAIWLAVIASRAVRPQPALETVTGVAALAGSAGIAAVALSFAFGLRTWRWSALTPGPVWESGPIWERWQHIPWWPGSHRQRRAERHRRPAPGSFSSASFWHRTAADVQARPLLWHVLRLTGGIAWVAFLAAIFARPAGRPGAFTSSPLWMLPLVGLFGTFAEPVSLKALVPWSRRDHLKQAYLGQLLNTVWYVLAAGPAAVAVLYFVRADPADVAQAARIIGATAVVLPLGHLVYGVRPGAAPWDATTAGWLAGGVLVLASTWAAFLNAVLPAILPSAAAQSAVLGAMVSTSQVLYWRHLRRHFSANDLVGNAGSGGEARYTKGPRG
jgi:hypothetical protein